MEFDKIIKDKIENADFEYDDSSWTKFNKLRKRKKFLKTSAIIGSVAVVVSAVVVIFLVSNTKHSQIQKTNSSTEVPHKEVFATDTNDMPETNLTSSVNEQSIKSDDAITFNKNSRKEEQQKDTFNRKSLQRLKTEKTVKHYGRPLIIDVDTIKENVPSDEELKKGNSRIF